MSKRNFSTASIGISDIYGSAFVVVVVVKERLIKCSYLPHPGVQIKSVVGMLSPLLCMCLNSLMKNCLRLHRYNKFVFGGIWHFSFKFDFTFQLWMIDAFIWWNALVNGEDDCSDTPQRLPPSEMSIVCQDISPIFHTHVSDILPLEEYWQSMRECLIKLTSDKNIPNPNEDFPALIKSLNSLTCNLFVLVLWFSLVF